MKTLTKLISTAVTAATVTYAATAAADPAIGVNPFGTGPGGGYTYTDLWTNLTDSALSTGFNPAILIPPGSPYDIRLIAQARVGTFSLGPNPVFPGFGGGALANVTYEVTKVLDINESVLSNNGTNANFGMTTQTADVDASTPGLQQLAIYFDTSLADGTQANPGPTSGGGSNANTVRCYGSTGDNLNSTGYPCPATGGGNDGILALSGHLVSNVSSFAASGSVGTGSFDLRFVIDYVNPAFLDITTGSIFGDKITGTTNVPSFFLPDRMWNGVAASSGLLLKVDSSESFIQRTVPEPGSLALLGIALAGLGAAARKRKSS